jgi:transposase
MVINKERFEAIKVLKAQGWTVSAIARHLSIDRKTVRTWMKAEDWRPYEREVRTPTQLDAHTAWLRVRAPEVNYSARILFQELRRDRGYGGAYDAVKRFVAPLRLERQRAEVTQLRFETAPGQQAQIDWGQVRVSLRQQPAELHVFVLTLGFSRRAYYTAYPNEQLGAFLEAHERAFEHFGGVCREHLYDRMRTVADTQPGGRWRWNATFSSFAAHWGFEPRVCQPYRAQTKGKVESGVKYIKGNFIPGRRFVDIVDFQQQLDEWNASIADQRIHGTTHEAPTSRWAAEQAALLPIAGHRAFGHCVDVSRVVADDYLVNFRTNRYSVPWRLIGKTVRLIAEGDALSIYHGEQLVAVHALVDSKHQVRALAEHGPRAERPRRREPEPTGLNRWFGPHEVEVRDLAIYEQVLQ